MNGGYTLALKGPPCQSRTNVVITPSAATGRL